MILADTSVWVEHLRRGSRELADLLRAAEVACHPFVIGELVCGNLRRRDPVLALLAALPTLPRVSDEELLFFVDRHRLAGQGLGLVDAHLLASCALEDAGLWTFDAKLAAVAKRLGLAAT